MRMARSTFTQLVWGTTALFLSANGFAADDTRVTQQQIDQLKRQNQLLQQQVEKQQGLIDDFAKSLSKLQSAGTSPVRTERPELAPADRSTKTLLNFGKVHLSAEGGVGIFRTESHGAFPNAEFRVDEAKLFIEAPLWKDIYFFSELNVTSREEQDKFMQPGEVYVDFENISRFWNRERQLNVRVGRFDIPFGEEYLTRDAIDNPLISHSVSDIWGVDEGIEIYGSFAKLQYAVALQNGGYPSLRDYDVDKSIAIRVGYDPRSWLHLSASAMRTGALNVQRDEFSELWFGNAFVRSLGDAGTTTTFQANVLEGDVQLRWSKGYLKGAGGYLKYDDNDQAADNQREVYYYYVEGLHQLLPNLYAAARWSQVLAPAGFPVLGNGKWMDYFIDQQTENLWRLSLGLGYRLGPNVLLKADYTFNQGKALGGTKRTHENMVAAVVAFRF